MTPILVCTIHQGEETHLHQGALVQLYSSKVFCKVKKIRKFNTKLHILEMILNFYRKGSHSFSFHKNEPRALRQSFDIYGIPG